MLSRPGRIIFRLMLLMTATLLRVPGLFGRLKRKKRLPPTNNVIYYKSATKLADMIRNHQVKSYDVVKAYIDRCNEVNPILNAIVETRYDLALEEAKRVDELIANGVHTKEEMETLYPLLGVPLTIKESAGIAGMSNNAGVYKHKSNKAEKDSNDVSKIKAAGGIPILVSNTPEMCLCIETFNYVTGQTKNPYDTRKTTGGSSGGEGALLSSGASVLGLGSDIAGSLRIPALYCGLFTHKPSGSVSSTVGHVPICTDPDYIKMFSSGPICRYAEDLRLLMKVIKDPNGPELQLEKRVSLKDMKFFYITENNCGVTARVQPEIKNAIQRVVDYFSKEHDIKVKEGEIKNLQHSFEISLLGLLKIDGMPTILSKPDNPDEWYSAWPEIFKFIFAYTKSIFACLVYCGLKKIGMMLSEEHYKTAEKVKEAMMAEFTELLQDNGVLFYPSMPYTAHFHNDYYTKIPDVCYMSIFNVMGFPAAGCPMGLAPNGMPVGIQIIAKPGNDHLLFTVAEELERAFGGWVPPPTL